MGFLLVLRSIVTESYPECHTNHYQGHPPCQGVVRINYFPIEGGTLNEEVEMNSFHQLPSKYTEKEIMEYSGNGGTQCIRGRDCSAIHTN